MDREERLALVVRAQVAAIRAEQARERHTALELRARPVFEAVDELRVRYGEDYDKAEHVEELKALVVERGGGDIPLKEIAPLLAQMSKARGDAEFAVAEAFHELGEAMGEGTSVREWVGCSDEEVERAVQGALDA